MENAIYASLGRLDGLKAELSTIANNIANVSTVGYKREGVIFSEYIVPMETEDSSLSMAHANLPRTDFSQGPLVPTNNKLDVAIDGDGFFLVQGAEGQFLTRAGSFKVNVNSELVTSEGLTVMDEGLASIFIPQEAKAITISSDGSVSADGVFLTKMGIFEPAEGDILTRSSASTFKVSDAPIPLTEFTVMQGFQEDSNVSAIHEVARLIEVHRAYERGSSLNKSEDERIKEVIKTLGAS